jgi:hypothetical protein
MKPVDQSILHDPSNGQFGDCMRAMVASILELSIDEVPHFMHDGTKDGVVFNQRVNAFLRHFNLGYVSFPECRDALDAFGVRGLVHEVSGQSERGVCHACVALDGAITHDPHPSKAGLLKIEDYGVFVVLDPSKPIRNGANP